MRMQRQLGRDDWVLAGLTALADGGAAAFRVEAVARALGVTKGSFYWHFRDRAAWRDAVLAYWEHRVFARLALGVTRAPGGGPEDGPDWRAVDAALRALAANDAAVARSLARVLRERALLERALLERALRERAVSGAAAAILPSRRAA